MRILLVFGISILAVIAAIGMMSLSIRAIILTSFTTAAGLIPFMTEGSVQAQTVIPVAVSLSFGIMSATAMALFLFPCLYVLREDGLRRMRQFRNGLLTRPDPQPAADTQFANLERH